MLAVWLSAGEQRTEDRGQNTEDRIQKENWEVGMRKAEEKKLRRSEDQKRIGGYWFRVERIEFREQSLEGEIQRSDAEKSRI